MPLPPPEEESDDALMPPVTIWQQYCALHLINPEVETQPRTARPTQTQSRQQALIWRERVASSRRETSHAHVQNKKHAPASLLSRSCCAPSVVQITDTGSTSTHVEPLPYCGCEENRESAAKRTYPGRHRFLFFSRSGANGEWAPATFPPLAFKQREWVWGMGKNWSGA
jgi:hypothetical protein